MFLRLSWRCAKDMPRFLTKIKSSSNEMGEVIDR